MSLLSQTTKGIQKKPIFVCMYSDIGIGKTTFGASAPSPYFIDIERSSDSLNVERFTPDKKIDLDLIMELLDEMYVLDKLNFKSIVIDTLDRLEMMIHKKVAEDNDKDSVDDIRYKNGYIYALDYWMKLLNKLFAIQDKHGTHVILLAHAVKRKFDDPHINESYDRFEIKLHHKASSLIKESVSMLLFAKKDVSVKKEKGSAKVKAFNIEKRHLYTQLETAFDAKNRVGLPPRIDMPENGAFKILLDAYDRASGETAVDVYKQCKEAIKRVTDDDLRKQMDDYIEQHKDDLNTLRATLDRIIEKTKG